ncbi:MAG: hypothetical protein KJ592_02320 [Nanoarchaeota archaeon]|nr:hypothetical protein [Nanoarchaeota archaeon]
MITKKIFNGVYDDEVHVSFLKFGRGEYHDKYLLEGKRQAKKWGIKAGAEYVNFLVRKCLEKFSVPPLDSSGHQTGQAVAITGVIVSTLDLRDEFKFEIVKAGNFQGVRKFQIASEIEPSQIIELMDKYPKAFFALSFKGDDFVLKIKAKGPTSGKPGKEKDEGPVADFCSLKTSDKAIVDELFFGIGDFTECKIKHTISVTDIVYPSNVAELKPAEIRELAKRKGTIKRIVFRDGVESESEAEFVA